MLLPRTSAAYTVPEHLKITKNAVQVFNACVEHHRESLTSRFEPIHAQEEILSKCNEMQDHNWPWLNRLKMWHFYSPKKPPKGSVFQLAAFAIETRLNGWIGLLQESFDATNDPAIAYALAGAAIHYVQDMTVPSHVVPIFHPGIFNWGDAFDSYLVRESSLPVTESSCREMFADRGNFETIINTTAEDTKASLHGAIDESKLHRLSWESFWDTSLDGDGFGKYGCFGNSFGDERLTCGTNRFEVEKCVYVSFARARHEQAVRGTISILAALQRKFSNDSPDCLVQKCAFPGIGINFDLAVAWRKNELGASGSSMCK